MSIEIRFREAGRRVIDAITFDEKNRPCVSLPELARLKGWNLFPGDILEVVQRHGDRAELVTATAQISEGE